MPYTAKQKRLFLADAVRAAKGEATETGLGKDKMKAMAKEPTKKPAKKSAKSAKKGKR